MKSLAKSIEIELGAEVLLLRPSLRHALSLECRPGGGFPGLLSDLQDGSLNAAVEVIKPHYCPRHLPSLVFDKLNELQSPLTQYVIALTGIDPDTKPSEGGKTLSFREHLLNLYKIGTGWLGWTPDVTLDATPSEIMLAYDGRIELLKAVFGTSDAETAEPDGKELDAKLKAAFGTFKTIKAKPKHKRGRASA
ncbi:hypothetical protein [Hyphomicrobium sp. MC1]|uniref:hypothetical protein n=1 Tax=Hyphomicrobium sp. (strain MC1) TaxID=717785 RepID=UPI000213EB22|nr:hypothetical protein [Hyphomicrobium sp. MC1]CCB65389.1 conserved protein of unknown function [Hyphomicrobium sp. MC1]